MGHKERGAPKAAKKGKNHGKERLKNKKAKQKEEHKKNKLKKEHEDDQQDQEKTKPTKEATTKKQETIKIEALRAPKGLANLGNTCFFNSTMQCLLANLHIIRRYIDEVSSMTEISNHRQFTTRIGDAEIRVPKMKVQLDRAHEVPMFWAFSKFVEDYDNNNSADPRQLFNQIKRVPRFRGWQQQDAHELLRYFMDMLRQEEISRFTKAFNSSIDGPGQQNKQQEERSNIARRKAFEEALKKMNGPTTHKCDDEAESKKQEKEEKSESVESKRRKLICRALIDGPARPKLDAFYSGVLQQTIECVRCGNISVSFEPFFDLSLPLKSISEPTPPHFSPIKPIRESPKQQIKGKGKARKEQQKQRQQKREEKMQREEGEEGGRVQDEEENEEERTEEKEEKDEDEEEESKKKDGGQEDEDTKKERMTKNVGSPKKNDGEAEKRGMKEAKDKEENGTEAKADVGEARKEASNPEEKDDQMTNGLEGNNHSEEQHSGDEEAIAEEQFPSRPTRTRTLAELCMSEGATGNGMFNGEEVWEGLSITKALRAFTSEEVLLGRTHAYRCEKCHAIAKQGGRKPPPAANARKRYLIWSPPLILTLHLKRFEQQGRAMRKFKEYVDFNMILDLAPFCSQYMNCIHPGQQSVLYRLYGVVCHYGELNGGHYVAFVRRHPRTSADVQRLTELFKLSRHDTTDQAEHLSQILHNMSLEDRNNGCHLINGNRSAKEEMERALDDHAECSAQSQWYYCSDSSVKPVTPEDVLRVHAYMLFYERVY